MTSDVLVVLLAGGLARRMGGGDKCLLPLGPVTILDHVIARLEPQAAHLMINANGDPQRFARFGLPVVGDAVAGFVGPLAGVLTGMRYAQQNLAQISDIVTVPTDGPFVPRDLVARLVAARAAAHAELAVASSGGRTNPVVGLWPVRLADALEQALVAERISKVDIWTARYNLVEVAFSTDPVDPFFNANTPDELAEAERLIETGRAER
jgi:molybdopterin-guanine dinucleotide biosynthesis protein A